MGGSPIAGVPRALGVPECDKDRCAFARFVPGVNECISARECEDSGGGKSCRSREPAAAREFRSIRVPAELGMDTGGYRIGICGAWALRAQRAAAVAGGAA